MSRDATALHLAERHEHVPEPLKDEHPHVHD
jgi:hypothetical protein